MNFIKRALANIQRGKTKTILLMITFFLIGNLVIVGLGITSAADNAKKAARSTMNPVVTIESDWEAWNAYLESLTEEEQNKIWEHYEDYYPYITEENLSTLMKDNRVVALSALNTNTAYGKDGANGVPLNNENEKNNGGGQSCYIDEDGNETCYEYVEPDLFIKSNMYPDMIEFHTGAFTVVEGRFYTQDEINKYAHVCLVTEEFAEYNNVKVGDDITFSVVDSNEIKNMDIEADENLGMLTCEVIGIYSTAAKVDVNSENYNWMSKYESPYNTILLPSTAYAEAYVEYLNIMRDYWSKMYDYEYSKYDVEDFVRTNTVTIMLDDPLNVDDFVKEYKNSVGDYRKLSSDNSTFNQMARPLDTLSLFANIIVWIVVVNAVVIITLVTALTLKNREYEIGVMLSIGVTKMKIVMQFFVELLIVAVLGFTLATVSGSLIAGKIGDSVLEYQITTENNYSDDSSGEYYYWDSVWNTNYYSTITQEEILSQYKVEISPLLIAEIYGLGLGVVFISILIPSFMIMRFNPKKILMSTN